MDKASATKSVFGFTRGDSNAEMPPLSPAQYRNLTSILSLLDEADPLYDHKDTKQYAAKFAQARELNEQSGDLFPHRDLRLNLLNATVHAYREVGVLLLSADLKQYDESPDPTMLAGRMRKLFLRKIIEGKLEAAERDALDFLLGQ